MTAFVCCDERRRAAVRRLETLPAPPASPNGIDFLEVIDHDFGQYAPSIIEADRQRVLHVWFLRPLQFAIPPDAVVIEGGTRIRNIRVLATNVVLVDGEKVLRVWVNEPGDFSTYTLRIINPAGVDKGSPHSDLDPVLASIDFRFKVECGTGLDCQTDDSCSPVRRNEPVLDYLARDFTSFRRLMLDRMSLLLPDFREQNPADLGVTLVEMLAYVGDLWSYRQDAIATEAYLGTAQHRISVRRHALLLDYRLRDGANARTWVRITLADGVASFSLPAGTLLFTKIPGEDAPVVDAKTVTNPGASGAQAFETMHEVVLQHAHNEMKFYSWGARECSLSKGATRATLEGHYPNLVAGDVLVFQEVIGPRSGLAADANPARRHAVRLTKVASRVDPLAGRLENPANDAAQNITEIAWKSADALPFALCISAITSEEHGARFVDKVSVAYGNVVLVDHGRTVTEDLAPVPAPDPRLTPLIRSGGCTATSEPPPAPTRFRPRLPQSPVTCAATSPIDPKFKAKPLSASVDTSVPAAAFLARSTDDALAVVTLHELSLSGAPPRTPWQVVQDLLSSGPLATDFVCETDDDGTTVLRFGDDSHGSAPAAGTRFEATYRVGNGRVGNIGAESIRHVIAGNGLIPGKSTIDIVTNPMPAVGGEDPESIEHARQHAPFAFRKQERAITPADYAEVASRHPEVQRAVATLRYTGSFYCVFLTVDRREGRPVDAAFAAEIARYMERYRLAGHDLVVVPPHFVAVELALDVCVVPTYFCSDVRRALLAVLGNRVLPDGRLGAFHPDRFTFGQPVLLSDIVALAQAVPGVSAVTVTKLRRLGAPETDGRPAGALTMADLEIARLDNDPSFPENGRLDLTLRGGR